MRMRLTLIVVLAGALLFGGGSAGAFLPVDPGGEENSPSASFPGSPGVVVLKPGKGLTAKQERELDNEAREWLLEKHGIVFPPVRDYLDREPGDLVYLGNTGEVCASVKSATYKLEYDDSLGQYLLVFAEPAYAVGLYCWPTRKDGSFLKTGTVYGILSWGGVLPDVQHLSWQSLEEFLPGSGLWALQWDGPTAPRGSTDEISVPEPDHQSGTEPTLAQLKGRPLVRVPSGTTLRVQGGIFSCLFTTPAGKGRMDCKPDIPLKQPPWPGTLSFWHPWGAQDSSFTSWNPFCSCFERMKEFGEYGKDEAAKEVPE